MDEDELLSQRCLDDLLRGDLKGGSFSRTGDKKKQLG